MKTINYIIGIIGVIAIAVSIYLQKPIKPIVEYIKGDTVTTVINQSVFDSLKYSYKAEIQKIKRSKISFVKGDTDTLKDTVYTEYKAGFNLGNSVLGTSGDVALVNGNFEFSNTAYRYPKITKTVVDTFIIKEKKFSSGIQVGAGYGLINGKFDVFIGYGFQLKF